MCALERFILVVVKLDPNFKDEVSKPLENACMSKETAGKNKTVLVIGTNFHQES